MLGTKRSEGVYEDGATLDASTTWSAGSQLVDSRYIAGYFDGDGTVALKPRKNMLAFELKFTDNYKPLLRVIARSLSAAHVETRFSKSAGAWDLVIRDLASVERLARAIAPYTIKKKVELLTVLDYLSNKITADEAIRVFNEQITIGKRRGKFRMAHAPYTRLEGPRISNSIKVEGLRADARRRAIKVPDEIKQKMKDGYALGLSQERIADMYHYSRDAVRRALGLRP